MYTDVETSSVIQAAQEVQKQYEALTGQKKITVLRTHRVKGYAGGTSHNANTSIVLTTAEAFNILKFGITCRAFLVGDALV